MSSFYQLTHEEFLETAKLKPAEKEVLYYLRTLAPFGDQSLTLSIRAIARALSAAKNREVSHSTVSRALKELDRLGLVEMELVKVTLKIKPHAPSLDVVSGDTTRCVQTPPGVATHHPVRTDTTCSPKPTTQKGSKTSHTIQTNKTNTQRERAEIFEKFDLDPKFKDFCYRKLGELPSRPVLVESWLIANTKELITLYESQPTQAVKSSADPVKISQPKELPKVAIALALGEVTQDPIFPEGIYDPDGNWWKKSEWEAQQQ